MNRWLWLGMALLGSTFAAVLSSYLTLHLASPEREHSHHGEDFHQWLHDNLDTTVEQEERMRPAEARFLKLRQKLEEDIRLEGKALARQLRTDGRATPEVERRLAQLHRLQGELQKITLTHFFEMKECLNPEQAEKLLTWTHDSIVH